MMPPITRRDVITHQSVVPWPSQVQVEQDYLSAGRTDEAREAFQKAKQLKAESSK